jgi:hypothetical protein
MRPCAAGATSGTDVTREGVCLEEYRVALARQGVRTLPGSEGTFWRAGTLRSLSRYPDICRQPLAAEEIRRLLRRASAPVATYVREPDEDHPQNAWLYICADREYNLEKLAPNARRDIRRAKRTFRYEFIDHPTLLENGTEAYCNTRQRVGLSDGQPQFFRREFGDFGDNPAHRIVGVWADKSFTGFATLTVVDDWVDIYPYVADEHLKGCPVNGLLDFILDYFLVQHGFRVVNYGLSSIQEVSQAQGLHFFKTRTGFECLPVHRAFVFHPLLTPLVNSASLQVLRMCRWLAPGDVRLRQAAGIISASLGHNPMPKPEQP